MKPGETFAHGKYTLLRKLRSSGMAEVWLARQHGTEGFAKDVVIKRILPHLAEDDKLVTMFLDEARIAANLSHPNVVHIFDLGNDGENYFIAMEYIRGYDIEQISDQLKSRRQPFPIEYAIRIIADTCLGLGYAHDCTSADGTPMNVVHRDVSPQNILVSHTGVVKLIDFGIAKARTSSNRTQVGHTKGKICYMSPEQMMARDLDRRSDLFSTAVVLYEMLCAEKPFDGDNLLACFHKLMKEGIPYPRELRPDMPPRLESIIMRGLARDREERYPTAAAFRAELEAFLREIGLSVGPEHLSDFLKWLFTAPESTQVVLDAPRIPSAPYSSPQTPQPTISTQDRISAMNHRPHTPPPSHLSNPQLARATPPHYAAGADVSLLEPNQRSEPDFSFESGPMARSSSPEMGFLPHHSSPHMMAQNSHFTGPEMGLPVELEDENPYRRRREQSGGGLWIWALFGFVLLIGAAIGASYFGYLPGFEQPPAPPPPEPDIKLRSLNPPPNRSAEAPPSVLERPMPDAGAGSPTVTPPRMPPTTPPPTPPVVRRTTPPKPLTKAAKAPKKTTSGCPRGRGHGFFILDTVEKGTVMLNENVDLDYSFPIIEPKRLPIGWYKARMTWKGGTVTKSFCIRSGRTTEILCNEGMRGCR